MFHTKDEKIKCLINSPSFLKCSESFVEECLHTNLLKSNCPVTNQPDWGTVIIDYKGSQIDKQSLLRYILSFRDHNEFHEQCVERIFMSLKLKCKPTYLKVEARFTRRGGIEINPVRSTDDKEIYRNDRLVRQ